MFKKLGFTLAEVLITLGIIGVVAAMTIPVLIQKYREKVTIARLKTTQSILSNMIKMAEMEHGSMDGWVSNPENNYETLIAYAEKLIPYVKVALNCKTSDPGQKCMYSGCYNRLSGICDGYFHGNRGYNIRLFNGVSIHMRPSESNWGFYTTKALIKFYVDTNGSNKPNQWGVDLFCFVYHPDYGLVAAGTPNIYFPGTCSNKSSTGYGCTYYILTQKNMNYLNAK